MDIYFYKCPVCGFIYQVPGYWVSYAPEEKTEMPHIDFRTGLECPQVGLDLQPDQG